MDVAGVLKFGGYTRITRLKGAVLGKLSQIIVSGRKLEISDLSALSSREIHDEAWLILGLPELPADIIQALLFHPDPDVRAALANHTSCPNETLETLLADDVAAVRRRAERSLKKRRSWWTAFSQTLENTWQLFRRSVIGTFKLVMAYMILSTGFLIFTDTASFVSAYSASNDELKAFVVCSLSFQVLEPTQRDFSSCAPFRSVGESKSRKISSVEFMDGECPPGYELESGIHVPHCVKTEH